ncbi:MAG: hypothetical protein ABI551_19000 [Polyangiaceae bacterium]
MQRFVSLGFAATTILAAPLFADVARADASASSSTGAAGVAPSERHPFAGTFTYAGGDKQRAGIDAAIETAITGMFFVAKPIARSKLHEKTAVKNSVGFSFAKGKITSTASGAAPATSKDDGTGAPYKVDGETIRVLQNVTPNAHLLQTFAATDGTRSNDYTLSADGKTLTMTVTLSSGKLPRAVHYALTYQRD